MIFETADRGLSEMPLTREEQIELNKKLSKLMTELKEETKDERCYYCGKTVTSFCNSHFVPGYCLENIAVNGEVIGPNAILKIPATGTSAGKPTPGIKASGTFSLICRECDSVIFRDYENPDNYGQGNRPTKKMLAQMAMKNFLKFIYKRKQEIALCERVESACTDGDPVNMLMKQEAQVKANVSKLDLEDYQKEFEKAKKYADTSVGKGYHLVYYELLEYVAPIAVQAPLALSIDLCGNVINDVFSQNKNLKISYLHLCILPQKNTTAVIMFTEEGCTSYRQFRRQLLSLDKESQLGVINYLVFLYTEDYFLARDIDNKINLEELKETVNVTPTAWSSTPIADTKALVEKFILSKWSAIPNLLSEEYKVR